jgi:hypothetical protein
MQEGGSGGQEEDSETVPIRNRKGAELPFALQFNSIEGAAEVVERDFRLQGVLSEMANNMLAKGSITTYQTITKHYRGFCEAQGYDAEKPREAHLLHYLATRVQEKASPSTMHLLRPALQAMWDLTGGGGEEVFTPKVVRLLDGAERMAAKHKPRVKKAAEVDLNLLKAAVGKYIQPYRGNLEGAEVLHMRTVARLVVEYFTMCRASDYMQLQVKHLTMKGPDIEIYFPKKKTDQLHEGNTTILLANETEFLGIMPFWIKKTLQKERPKRGLIV